MSIAVTDPLHALSLARTALSDPEALPSNCDFDPDLSMAGESADPAQVAYAIAQIDHAIGGLYFEPFDDPAREAGVTLEYQDYRHPAYPQLHPPFVPYLSAVDLLFNCGPQSLEILAQ